jgi:hypothetical protein
VDDLRKSITYIPQDAVLFTGECRYRRNAFRRVLTIYRRAIGTVRENLDPFNEHSDEELLSALEKVQLGVQHGRYPGWRRELGAQTCFFQRTDHP